MFRVLDIFTVKCATGDLPEEMSFPVNDPTSQVFYNNELIRSLTEAETITVDIPEGQVTHGALDHTTQDQEVDPKKVRPIQKRIRAKVRVNAAPGVQ